MTAYRQVPAKDPELLIAHLVPVATERRECLALVADSIAMAGRHTPDRWGLTLRRGMLRLNVGMIEVLTIKPNIFHWVVDYERVPAHVRADLTVTFRVWRADPDRGTYESVPGSSFIDVEPLSAPRIASEIRDAHQALVVAAAATPRNPSTIEGHTPAALEYISRAVGRALPFPLYG